MTKSKVNFIIIKKFARYLGKRKGFIMMNGINLAAIKGAMQTNFSAKSNAEKFNLPAAKNLSAPLADTFTKSAVKGPTCGIDQCAI